LPGAQWHQYEPVHRDNVITAARASFGEDVDTRYRSEQADVIVALDADFLGCGRGHLRYVRDFTAKRRVTGEHPASMTRLYAVESTPTNTGAMADHRLALRAGQIDDIARAIASGLGVSVPVPPGLEVHAKWIAALVRDLQAHRGSSIVLAGDEQPPSVH